MLKHDNCTMQRVSHAFLMLSFVVASGCNTTSTPDYASLGLVEVAGHVTLDGKPLENVEVRLVEDGSYSFGRSDTNGKFRMMLDSEQSGVVPGTKTLVIVPRSAGESEEDSEPVEEKTSNPKATRIPERYGPHSQVQLEITGPNSNLHLELKSDGNV